MTAILLNNICKVFGADSAAALHLLQEGVGKEEIRRQTGAILALRDVSITVGRGEILAVVGLSGSGKSTLLRVVNRLIEPTDGTVTVYGEDVLGFSGAALQAFRRQTVSMVFQGFGLLPHRTVTENVGYGMVAQRRPRHEWEEMSRQWIQRVGLSGYETAYPFQLSGGMRQRVGLARALATQAPVLLMDEPFSALDPIIRHDMQDLLLSLQAELQKTIVVITHDLNEAVRLGDRVAVLNDGSIVQTGRPAEIILRPANDYVSGFAVDVNRLRTLKACDIMVPSHAGQAIDLTVAEDASIEEVLSYQVLRKEPIKVTNSAGLVVGEIEWEAVRALLKRDI